MDFPKVDFTTVFDELKTILSTIAAEVNLQRAMFDAAKAWPDGGLAAVLTAILADATNVFPDPKTRPYAILLLQAWSTLVTSSKPA